MIDLICFVSLKRGATSFFKSTSVRNYYEDGLSQSRVHRWAVPSSGKKKPVSKWAGKKGKKEEERPSPAADAQDAIRGTSTSYILLNRLRLAAYSKVGAHGQSGISVGEDMEGTGAKRPMGTAARTMPARDVLPLLTINSSMLFSPRDQMKFHRAAHPWT